MTGIFVVKKNNNIDKSLFEQILKTLPKNIKDKILAKVFLHDREINLISQILLYHCLSQKLEINRDELIFSNNDFGKPYLKNFPQLSFNLSHSGDYIVLAISKSEVGIDVEKERNFDLDIVEQFFSSKEIEFFRGVKEDEKLSAFFSIWTLKESYIKALGLGLNKSLSSFSVDMTSNNSMVTDHENPENNSDWTLYNIPLEKDYHLAICHNSQEEKVKSISNISVEELLSYYH